jgi:hypothetical protein
MEVPQGISLCSYLKQPKMSFFFSFLYKIGGQEGITGPIWKRGRSEKMVKEGEYDANTVFSIQICEWKNDIVETIPGIGG